MTVRELRDFLSQFPDDTPILETRYSDFGPMDLNSWRAVQAIERVSGKFGWAERVNAMTEENRRLVKTYPHYAGN